MLNNIILYLPTALTCIILTCIIELFIAALFGVKHYKVVIAANVTTQVLLHIVLQVAFYTRFMYRTPNTVYILYIVLEILIFVSEFLMYFLLIKNRKKSFLVLFSLVANLASYLTGLLIGI